MGVLFDNKEFECINDDFLIDAEYEDMMCSKDVEEKKISMIICHCCKNIFIQRGKEAIYAEDGRVYCSEECKDKAHHI